MIFCWYIPFYIIVLVVFPLVIKFEKRINSKGIEFVVLVIVVPLLLRFLSKIIDPYALISTFALWMPPVMVGTLCAKYDFFQKILAYQQRICCITCFPHKLGWYMMISFAIAGRCIVPNILLSIGPILDKIPKIQLEISLDFLYVCIFLFGLINLIKCYKTTVVSCIFKKIGEKSMLLWSVHCLFFNEDAVFTQKYLYIPHNPIIVLIWGVLVCYGFSCMVELIYKTIVNANMYLSHTPGK